MSLRRVARAYLVHTLRAVLRRLGAASTPRELRLAIMGALGFERYPSVSVEMARARRSLAWQSLQSSSVDYYVPRVPPRVAAPGPAASVPARVQPLFL